MKVKIFSDVPQDLVLELLLFLVFVNHSHLLMILNYLFDHYQKK